MIKQYKAIDELLAIKLVQLLALSQSVDEALYIRSILEDYVEHYFGE